MNEWNERELNKMNNQALIINRYNQDRQKNAFYTVQIPQLFTLLPVKTK